MKKNTIHNVIALLLALVMLMSMAACGSAGNQPQQPADNAGGTPSDNAAPADQPGGAADGLSDETLVVGIASETSGPRPACQSRRRPRS